MPFFGVCQLRDPLTDFQINWHSWLRRGPHPTRKNWVNQFKEGASAHAWNCHPRASIFSLFLGSMRLATGRPVGPILTVSDSNDALWWPLRPFYGFVNKKIFFSILYPKMWKIALRPMGTLNSYNFGTDEDTYKLFAPNRVFSGSANLMVSFKLTPNQPLLPWQPIVVIKHNFL